MNSRKAIKFVAGAAVVLQMLLPVAATAQNDDAGTSTGSGRSAQVRARVCDRLVQFGERATERFQEGKGRMSQVGADLGGRLSERHANRIERLEQVRSAHTERHTERFNLLLAKFQDNDRKEAILEFQQSVQTAVDARRAAYDAAIEAFWADAGTVVDTRRAAVDAAVADYEAAVNAAVASAKTACDGEGDLATIRKELNASLEAARDSYRIAIQSVKSYADMVQELVDERNAAFEAARDAFQAALEAAKTTLHEKLSALVPEGDDDADDDEDEGDDEDVGTDTGTAS